MFAERLLQLSTATMAALGALLLRMGGNDVALAYLAAFAAVTSVLFTDWLQWFRLHRFVSNAAALVAVSTASLQFIAPSANELMAIANLLIYLQIILLYQTKNQRVYWHLCVLSLLQVVVAAALNLQVEFGVLLVAYVFIGLATMTLLFLRNETLRFGNDPSHENESASVPALKGFWRVSRSDPMPIEAKALQEGALQGGVLQEGTNQIDLISLNDPNPAELMMNWRLARHVLQLGVTTLAVTIIVFFLTPRLGSSRWRSGHGGGKTVVGFHEGVSLSELTSIRDNPELVMRVKFTTLDGGAPYKLRNEPYFRGAVLNTYESRKGEWNPPVATRGRSTWWQELPSRDEPEDGVRQSVLMRSVVGPSAPLFSVQPTYRLADTPTEIKRRIDTGKLSLGEADGTGAWSHLHFAVETTAFRNGWQREITPHALSPLSYNERSLLRAELDVCSQFDAITFPRLSELAGEILNDSGIDATQRIRVARVLEHYLRFSRQYSYSSELIPPSSAVDPVEHFVAETKTGHCEYFASALALMLRSQKIPARLVVGFRGGDLNQVGNYYQVRQRNAHAWVEAYLRSEDVAHNQLEPDEVVAGGAWLRLDPTPAEVSTAEAMMGITVLARLNHVRDYFQMLWDDYVLGLDPDRQREAIYQPLKAKIAYSIRNMLFNAEWRELFARNFRQRIGLTSWQDFYERWFNWRAIPMLMSLALICLALYRALRRPVRWTWLFLAKRWRRWRSRTRHRQRWRVEFYHRLERVLAAHGIRRDANTTHREFAQLAVSKLKLLEGGTSLSEQPQQITEAFYRVRFGGQSLSESEVQEMDDVLKRLEVWLARS